MNDDRSIDDPGHLLGESAPQRTTPQPDPGAETPPEPDHERARPRPLRTRVAVLGVAAALLFAVGTGTGIAAAGALQAAGSRTTVSGAAAPATPEIGRSPDSGEAERGLTPGDRPDGFGGSGGSGSARDLDTTVATAEQVAGVVTIETRLGYASGAAAGTGFVLTADGRVLTNNHVVEGATEIEVTDESTGRAYSATVVGTNASADVAVLQLRGASGLATVDTGSGVGLGDDVTAIGNAEGTGTLVAAAGTVTDLGQGITAGTSASRAERLTGLIEFDADVVSGDSGGPLVDEDGDVIGITTAAGSAVGSDILGYAIPIGTALGIAEQIVNGEDTADITIGYPAFLGVSLAEGQGALVGEVIPGTPAEDAGLEAGDGITAVDGDAVASADALTAAIRSHEPGDTVTLTVTDGSGSGADVQVTLITGPAD